MELFGPHTVNSIADLLGINTNTNTDTNTNQANEKEERETAEEHEANRYLIRRGNEKDVFQENVRKSEDKSCGQGRLSDYTYDDYKNEFEREATAEEVYADDVRLPAEYEITDCETFQAGRLPDNKFFLMKISLPDEDPKTIDVDVKADKVLLFSYHFKCIAYWDGQITPSLASSTWNQDTHILTIKAPLK